MNSQPALMRSPARANPGKRYFVLLFRTEVDTSQGSGFSSIQLVSVAGRKTEREKEKTSILCYSPRHHRFDSSPQKKKLPRRRSCHFSAGESKLYPSRFFQIFRANHPTHQQQQCRNKGPSRCVAKLLCDDLLPNLLPLSLRDFHCLSSDLP